MLDLKDFIDSKEGIAYLDDGILIKKPLYGKFAQLFIITHDNQLNSMGFVDSDTYYTTGNIYQAIADLSKVMDLPDSVLEDPESALDLLFHGKFEESSYTGEIRQL